MPLFFRQLFEAKSSTFTYILADTDSKEAIIIDPCEDTVDRDSSIIRELGLNLIFALNTHCHADHITGIYIIYIYLLYLLLLGTWKLKKNFPHCKSVISLSSGAQADVTFDDNAIINFGQYSVIALATPGHTLVSKITFMYGCS